MNKSITPSTRQRYRFGVRSKLPLFKNVGILVFYLPREVGNKLEVAITMLKTELRRNGNGAIADLIVWEESAV